MQPNLADRSVRVKRRCSPSDPQYRYACPECGKKWRFMELDRPRVPEHKDESRTICPGTGGELWRVKNFVVDAASEVG